MEALKQAVNKGFDNQPAFEPDTRSPRAKENEEMARNNGSIIVESSMMNRLNSPNKSYVSSVDSHDDASQKILLERDSIGRADGSSILYSSSSILSSDALENTDEDRRVKLQQQWNRKKKWSHLKD